MLEIKISELPSKTTTIDPNDLLEVSEWDSGTSSYISKRYEAAKILPSGYYYSYVALLNQTGTLAPTETILGINGTILWTRVNQGKYNGYLPGAFTLDRTAIFAQTTSQKAIIQAVRIDVDNIMINTFNVLTGAYEDDLLTDTPFKIEVYP